MPAATLRVEKILKLNRNDFLKFLGMFFKSSFIADWKIWSNGRENKRLLEEKHSHDNEGKSREMKGKEQYMTEKK